MTLRLRISRPFTWLPIIVGCWLGALGCGGAAPTPPQAAADPLTVRTAADSTPSPTADTTVPVAATVPPSEAPADRLHQTFAQATRPDDPPADANRPPDELVTKKPVYKIYAEVQRQWDSIRFLSSEGKRLEYVAQVETSLGPIEIKLLSENAPNHVRNFIALARAGYYDGLFFDGLFHDEAKDENGTVRRLDQIWAGCPLGTGETGSGSIGYWLKPEFNARANNLTHDEGVVGAVRLEEADTAATRFYINMGPAPYLDDNSTIFGKVVLGLDVVRKIGKQSYIEDEVSSVRRPLKPVVINKVTIQEK